MRVLRWAHGRQVVVGDRSVLAGRISAEHSLLIGREVPDLPEGLGPRLAVARASLGSMKPAEFEGAEARIIHHRAGFADVEQTGEQFLHLFGLPNFFFHLTMGYAALRAAGVPLGKEDFDGIHSYPKDFRF